MRPHAAILALGLCSVLLAGCTGNSVTISGQGYASGTESQTISCGPEAHIALGVQGAGKMSVSVLDGEGRTVFQSRDVSAGSDDERAVLAVYPAPHVRTALSPETCTTAAASRTSLTAPSAASIFMIASVSITTK